MTNIEVKQERARLEAMNYVSVNDLNHECLEELKQNYLYQLVQEVIYAETMEVDYDEPSYYDLANVDELVPDAVVLEVYADVQFSPDDFFCLMETEE